MDSLTKAGDQLLAQPAEQGAVPIIHAATAADVLANDCFRPDSFLEQRGRGAKRAARRSQASDAESARRLWEISTELTDVDYPWPESDD